MQCKYNSSDCCQMLFRRYYTNFSADLVSKLIKTSERSERILLITEFLITFCKNSPDYVAPFIQTILKHNLLLYTNFDVNSTWSNDRYYCLIATNIFITVIYDHL